MTFASVTQAPSDRVAAYLVLAVAGVVAIVSARGYAGSWNDGS